MTGLSLRLRAALVLPDRLVADGVVEISSGRVAAVSDLADMEDLADATAEGSRPQQAGDAVPLPGLTVLPGLVDLHCHGGGGGSFTVAERASATAAARHHLIHGTTSTLASLVTAPPGALLAGAAMLGALARQGEIAGVHLEGPFLSAVRCGAQDPARLLTPDAGLLDDLLAAADGQLRQMTIAPELPGALALVERLVAAGVVAAVGHTDADVRTATAAFHAGASLTTHLFNGMRPLHHRDPGPVAAALSAAADGRAVVEVIGDGVHLADATISLLFTLLGPHRIALVTDAMAAAGMPDGRYQLGRQAVRVAGGVARLDDGTPAGGSIAGSTATLLDVVRRTTRAAGVPLVDAVAAASQTPARVLGLDGEVGVVAAGSRADLVCVDTDLRCVAVMRAGRWVHGAPALPPAAR